MGKFEKLIVKLLSGNADKNFDFIDLLKILEVTGFTGRIRGSHHIFIKENVEEIINLQPNGKLAKAYQVKQVRELLLKYKLIPNDES